MSACAHTAAGRLAAGPCGSGSARGDEAALPAGLDLALIDAVPGRLGLAVSGGGDSTALAVLVTRLRPAREVVLLTMDHGLRQEAALDVAAVEALGRRLGRPVVRLAPRTAPCGSLQAWARAERYARLAEAARRHGLAAVATGHTLEDQAETVLLRLARGSGLKGLGAMRPVSRLAGLTVLRPLLGVSRQALREVLVACAVPWREDPSNADPRFDRVAMRRLAPQLAAVGLTSTRLAQTARHLARAGEVVDTAVEALLAEAMTSDRAGAVRLARGPLGAAPDEVRLRALAAAVQKAGGRAHPPRFAALSAADAAMAVPGGSTTLGRARLRADDAGILLWREARGLAPLALGSGEEGVFDGRFHVALAPDCPPVQVRAIGTVQARAVPTDAFGPAVATAPAIVCEGTVVAAPTLLARRRDWPADFVRVRPVR